MVGLRSRRRFFGAMGAGLAAAVGACTRPSHRAAPPRGEAQESGAREGEARASGGGKDPAMPVRTLGRTGVSVSLVGLGGYHIGIPHEQESIRIIRSAIDRGVTFMDNCWDYHDGDSERRMGKALRDGYRERVFLMTKIDGRTREAADRQIDESLRRLQTDRLDLLQFHEIIRASDPGRGMDAGGAMEAAVRARKAGKVRFIGFTGHKSPAMHMAMVQRGIDDEFIFDTVQLPLNVMDAHYDSFERGVLPAAAARNMGIIGMKSMGGGHIVKAGIVTARECLHYVMSLPVSVVVVGCSTMKMLDEAIEAASSFQPMSDAERHALLARTAPAAQGGKLELYKTSEHFDGTTKHPEWLG